MAIQQLSIFLENKSGRLTEVTEKLAEENINIIALTLADTSEYGVLRLIVSDPEKAVKVLKESHLSVSLTQVVGVSISTQAGSFAKLLKLFSEENISIEYVYAFSMYNNAAVILRTEEKERVLEILTRNSLPIIKPEDLYHY